MEREGRRRRDHGGGRGATRQWMFEGEEDHELSASERERSEERGGLGDGEGSGD